MLQVLYQDILKVDQVLHLLVRVFCCALMSPPLLLLPCILLRLQRGRWRGRATGWWRGCECTLSPSLTQAGSASAPSTPLVFLLRGMLRWDSPVGGPRRQPTVQLAKLRSDTLLVPDVRTLVPP
jgi:hypothetical protein